MSAEPLAWNDPGLAAGAEDEGAALLDEVHAALTRFVVLPSPETADAVAVYVAATHGQAAWEHATRLVVKSPLKRCGKSRLQEVIAELCNRPLRTTNISVAALVRSIPEDDPPTLVLDEADAVFKPRRGERSESAEDLRGILNSGHSRGWPYVRWDAATRTREECPTFAMAVIGGIGDMPDTIEDRAIIVPMRRRAPGERVAPFRRRRAVGPLHELRDRLHVWVRTRLEELAEAEPDLPVEDRAADTWEPLVVLADAAGGDWPERIRTACKVLAGRGEPDESDDASLRLLADLRAVWRPYEEGLFTRDVIARLITLDEAPWATWHRGDPISQRAVATLLRPYDVRSRNVRSGDEQAKGYYRADLADPWRRYLPGAGTPTVPAVPPSQTDETAGQTGDAGGTQVDSQIRPTPDQDVYTGWDAGTDGTNTLPRTEQPCPSESSAGALSAKPPSAPATSAPGSNGPTGPTSSPADTAPPTGTTKSNEPCCQTGQPVQLRCQMCQDSPSYWRNRTPERTTT